MLIYGEKVFLPEKGFKSAYINTEGGKIVSISEKCDKTPDISAHYVFPGFIDIHTHGAMGGDTIDCDYNALVEMKKYMANHGTTAFMPTALSATIDTIVSSIENAKKVKNTISDGADIAGMYIEGPYFTEKFKGAHLAHFLKAPSNEELDRMIEAGEGLVRIICLAPEYENAKEFIEYATSKDAPTIPHIEDILIICDDLDTKVGDFRLRYKGSSGGHNGLKDIEKNLGTQEYSRLKIGIANNKFVDTKDYVLGKFSKNDLDIYKELAETIRKIIDDFFELDVKCLMNKYNRRNRWY